MRVLTLLWTALLLAGCSSSSTSTSTLTTTSIAECSIPAPQTPEFNNVDQFILLSNRWGIVIHNSDQEIIEYIDEQTSGELSPELEKWHNSYPTGNPNYTARNKITELYNQYEGLARIAADEHNMKATNYYTLSSKTDSAYSTNGIEPAKIALHYVGVGNSTVFTYQQKQFKIYSYVEFPSPMQPCSDYTITLKNGKSVSYIYDENSLVARSIKINQLGYVPGNENYAYVGSYLHSQGPMDISHISKFDVVNDFTKEVVYQGQTRVKDLHSRIAIKGTTTPDNDKPYHTGEDLLELDLSSISTPGQYYIRVPGVGRSWAFTIGTDIYGEAFYHTMRALYHQRGSIALQTPYTHWERPQYHSDSVYETSLPGPLNGMDNSPWDDHRFDIIGNDLLTLGSPYLETSTEGVVGGWYDAADYDRNAAHYSVILNLLNLYEISPEKFTDNQLNIPESGNGIPDILDEAEFGLRVYYKSMTDEGGVSGCVESYTHTAPEGEEHFAFCRRTYYHSLLFSAAAAQLSRLVEPFDVDLANQYKEAALLAYSYGTDDVNKFSTITLEAKKSRGVGDSYTVEFTPNESVANQVDIMAKQQLFLLTKDDSYMVDVEAMLNGLSDPYKPYIWPYSFHDYSNWIYYPLVTNPAITSRKDLISEETQNTWKEYLISPAKSIIEDWIDQTPYRKTWEADRDSAFTWGFGIITNYARGMLIADMVDENSEYRRQAMFNVDFTLGANPMGMSWVTGIGNVYPVEIQTSWNAHAYGDINPRDEVTDPPPGYIIYGINELTDYCCIADDEKLTANVWSAVIGENNGVPIFETFETFDEPLPLWRRYFPDKIYNTKTGEFTIQETISGAIFTFGMLMEEGWLPSTELKNRGPRPVDKLYGYYPLQ